MALPEPSLLDEQSSHCHQQSVFVAGLCSLQFHVHHITPLLLVLQLTPLLLVLQPLCDLRRGCQFIT
jgi:hypothetical protein